MDLKSSTILYATKTERDNENLKCCDLAIGTVKVMLSRLQDNKKGGLDGSQNDARAEMFSGCSPETIHLWWGQEEKALNQRTALV